VIPAAAITAWSTHVPWANPVQVEQDLPLSRCIVEIANHPYLGAELIFRGTPCGQMLGKIANVAAKPATPRSLTWALSVAPTGFEPALPP